MTPLIRWIIRTIVNLLYRVEFDGRDRIPAKGGAVIACNHQSYLDAVLLSMATDRPIRFVISSRVAQTWFVRPFARMTNSIPIEPTQSPRELIKALREAAAHVRDGGLLGIFPEGQITRIGRIVPFRRGIERIMRDLDAPIIPAALDGGFETGFSFMDGGFSIARELRWRRHRLRVVIGESLPSQTPFTQLRQAILELQARGYAKRIHESEPLHRLAIGTLRRRSRAHLLSDHASGGTISNAKVLAAIVALGTKLRPVWKDEDKVGILLPPSIGAVAVNVAALLAGRVPVNLNYSVNEAVLAEICDNAGIRVIVTSRVFLAKVRLQMPAGTEVHLLEDVRSTITGAQRIAALIRGLYQPVGSLERSLGRKSPARVEDLATLVYSSGSTGTPKGVMLTHWNIVSNVTACCQAIRFEGDDRLLGILPFFHSFGFMVTLWLPLMRGIGVSYHPTPLDGRGVGNVVETMGVTHILATPTFLSIYSRACLPQQFGSVRVVIAGAEKLRASIADAFENRFGIRPIEGYGCTECSPVVAMCTPDWREKGVMQQSTKRGTVGHPPVGVVVRVEDPATGERLPVGREGMLLVNGPNVMQGYYKSPERSAGVLRDGWYVTGDIARLDEDGFITITDRLSRFSKIGGEMVPHLRVEEALQVASGAEEPSFAVAGIPDPRKGERLAVLTTLHEKDWKAALDRVASGEMGLPALWVPRAQDFIPVKELPLLGSGKLDLKQVKAIAQSALASAKPEA
jgi:acyl-[acyl-carrier-protein]-phospholipid O-acyltransferase/long-chain-fatty-acid--[acyl-carrier-protein] ligase